MNGEDVDRWGGKLHGQIRGGDDNVEGVERRAAEEDIIRCRCVDDEKADKNCLCLGTIAEDGMEVNVAATGDLFPRKAINRFIILDYGGVWELKFLVRSSIEDVDGTALVDEEFLNCVIFYFNGDDHRVILLVIKTVEIIVREGYGRHAASVMRMGDVVDGLDMAEVSLFGG